MRNIFKIINTDAHRIFSSVVVLVILMGLCVVPSLYAWFNIFSNWDPYGQSATSRIRVAIADVDRGADLFGPAGEQADRLGILRKPGRGPEAGLQRRLLRGAGGTGGFFEKHRELHDAEVRAPDAGLL